MTNLCFTLSSSFPLFIYFKHSVEGIIGETLSKFSIWSLYITFVLAVGRFIRLQCSDLRMRIPYENLPSCDRYTNFTSSVIDASTSVYVNIVLTKKKLDVPFPFSFSFISFYS